MLRGLIKASKLVEAYYKGIKSNSKGVIVRL